MKLNEGTLFHTNEKVAQLNHVAGFDPLKHIRNTADGAVLDLKYKKLWFRLKFPNGKIRLLKHKISEKIAIIEARVYLDRKDTNPVSSFTAQREKTTGNRYIEEAQFAAEDQALTDAGFGLQFLPNVPTEPQKVVSAPQVKTEPKTVAEKPTVKAETKTVVQPTEQPKAVAEEPKAVVAEVPKVVAQEPKTDLLQFVEDNTPENIQKEVKTEDPLLAFADVLDQNKAQESETQNETVAETPAQPQVVEASAVAEETVTDAATSAPTYTKDMSVKDICGMMSVEDAENYVVEIGSVKGWKMIEVYEKRRPLLNMYVDTNKYKGDDNILRAAATLVLASRGEKVAA